MMKSVFELRKRRIFFENFSKVLEKISAEASKKYQEEISEEHRGKAATRDGVSEFTLLYFPTLFPVAISARVFFGNRKLREERNIFIILPLFRCLCLTFSATLYPQNRFLLLYFFKVSPH